MKIEEVYGDIILVADKLAGFAMVIDLPGVDDKETDFQMAEFFICINTDDQV